MQENQPSQRTCEPTFTHTSNEPSALHTVIPNFDISNDLQQNIQPTNFDIGKNLSTLYKRKIHILNPYQISPPYSITTTFCYNHFLFIEN